MIRSHQKKISAYVRQSLTDPVLVAIFISIAGLLLMFWSGSRYPELSAKAAMGGSLGIADLLGFDALVTLSGIETLAGEIGRVFLNWTYSNWKGMSFGFALAVLLGVLLLRLRQNGRALMGDSTLVGLLVGIPLGLCVNCAAPVATSIYRQTGRLGTAVAAMLSSPALNVLVLGMIFSLLPLHLALLKVAGSLVLVLFIAPLFIRWFTAEEAAGVLAAPDEIDAQDRRSNEPPLQWLFSNLVSSARSLLIILLPLMLVAGLLGSTLVVIMPWDEILTMVPQIGMDTQIAILTAMCLIALFAVVLPVPITFDVFIGSALMATGLPVHYVMVLVFGLGSYSVYPALILWRAGLWRLGLALGAATVSISILLGVLVYYVDKHLVTPRRDLLYQSLSEGPSREPKYPMAQTVGAASPARIALPDWFEISDRISTMSLESTQHAGHGPLFLQRDVAAMGIAGQRKAFLHETNMADVPLYLGGIASGDINNDGWYDVALATVAGPRLFINLGGTFHPLVDSNIDYHDYAGVVMFADIDNDGWQDLLYSRYRKPGVWHRNLGGSFGPARALPDGTRSHLPLSVAAADLDRNGHLDLVWGGHMNRFGALMSDERSRNYVLYGHGNRFSIQAMRGEPGETLSILISDLDHDGWQDVWIGNDFEEPDIFYLGTPAGLMEQPEMLSESITTMSIDAGDLHNDGSWEVFHAQIAEPLSGVPPFPRRARSRMVDNACEANTDCERHRALLTVIDRDPVRCMSFSREIRDACILNALLTEIGMSYLEPASKTDELCGLIEHTYPRFYRQCQEVLLAQVQKMREFDFDSITASGEVAKNTLQSFALSGGEEVAHEYGVEFAGWAWNARFADLDLDGYSDLYVVNGFSPEPTEPQNLWYRNKRGQGLEESARQAGLDSYARTLSYTYIDFDNDGDQDLILTTVSGEVLVYQNQSSGSVMQIELRDAQGNYFGIGSKITIRTEAGTQIRELRLSGGYMSFDAPVAVFSLGDMQQVSDVRIDWSTGESEMIEGPFLSGNRYRIFRK